MLPTCIKISILKTLFFYLSAPLFLYNVHYFPQYSSWSQGRNLVVVGGCNNDVAWTEHQHENCLLQIFIEVTTELRGREAFKIFFPSTEIEDKLLFLPAFASLFICKLEHSWCAHQKRYYTFWKKLIKLESIVTIMVTWIVEEVTLLMYVDCPSSRWNWRSALNWIEISVNSKIKQICFLLCKHKGFLQKSPFQIKFVSKRNKQF